MVEKVDDQKLKKARDAPKRGKETGTRFYLKVKSRI